MTATIMAVVAAAALFLLVCTILVSVTIGKYYSFHDIDRYCLRVLIRNWSKINEWSQQYEGSKNSFVVVANILKVYGGGRDALAKATSGSWWCGLYLFEKHMDVLLKYTSKLAWDAFFVKYDIRTPLTYCTCTDGVLNCSTAPTIGETYVKKPVNGLCGLGVELYTHKSNEENEALCATKRDYLIQSFLKDCTSETSRHYRVSTLYDGSIFSIVEYNAQHKDQLSSNRYMGASTKTIWLKGDDPNKIDERLYQFSIRLAEAHQREFPMVICIGFDVMHHCERIQNKYYALEGNLMPGVFSDDDDLGKTDAREMLRRICIKFLKTNNYAIA